MLLIYLVVFVKNNVISEQNSVNFLKNILRRILNKQLSICYKPYKKGCIKSQKPGYDTTLVNSRFIIKFKFFNSVTKCLHLTGRHLMLYKITFKDNIYGNIEL